MDLTFNPTRPGYPVSYDFRALPPPSQEGGDGAEADQDGGAENSELTALALSAAGRPFSEPMGEIWPPMPSPKTLGPQDDDQQGELALPFAPGELEGGETEADEPSDALTAGTFEMVGGGSPPDDPPPALQLRPPDRRVTGCAVGGTMFAIMTIDGRTGSWVVDEARSRLFSLTGRSQVDLRRLAAEVCGFVRLAEIDELGVCRLHLGMLEKMEDEVRIESSLKMIPGLPVVDVSDDDVAKWVFEKRHCWPNVVGSLRPTLVEMRAVELACYMATKA